MKDFFILFREPDGRAHKYSDEDNREHQQKVKTWMEPLMANGNLAGGRALTLNGRVIKTNGAVLPDIYKVGTEIVGGYMLLKSNNLDEATEIVRACPVLERGGFVEVREVM